MTDIYFYKLSYYNEFSDKDLEVSGLVVGDSLSSAMAKLSENYGEENIIAIMDFEQSYNEGCMELPEGLVDQIKYEA